MTGIYNIPATMPFADTLVRGILEKYGNDPLTLNDIILLLPSRRSCRSVQEAFLNATGGKPTLLPKMQPLGDLGDEEFTFKISLGAINADLPVALSSIRQRLLLAKLIEQFQGGYIGKNKITLAQSANLSIDLAKFLDEVNRQQLPLDRLHNIVPDDLARHWQITLDFMEIIIKKWPAVLAEKDMSDAVTHRNISLQLLAKYWQEKQPEYPVIAAGSTGSIPATANLLKIIAKMPHGSVILPGLDQIMDDNSWENIEDTHPQNGLKFLLENLAADRRSVKVWGTKLQVDSVMNIRASLLSRIMLPAISSDKWQEIKKIPDEAISGISRIDAPTLQDEASIIALIFRNTLEVQGKTAALITNDQNLSAHVIGIMEKWGVQLDNSSGTPLSEVTPCVFIRLIARMIEANMSPISLLSCLKHPMARFKMEAAQFKNKVREIEIEVLRGLRIHGGIYGTRRVLEEIGKTDLANWLGELEEVLRPFSRLMNSNEASLKELIEAHIKVALDLAQTNEISGTEHLWGRDEGEALHEFFDELLEASPELGNIQPSQYYGILEALLAGKAYRPKYGSHPRLSILSPMEARMQSFDLCILGGMNEGTWPPTTEAGPWMSRPMRKSFGLPLPERQIGQSAHDFVQAFGAPKVVLTRSEKVDGTATIPSRWIMRLEAVLDICGKISLISPSTPWLEISNLLAAPERMATPCQPPSPIPSQEFRPLEISVTSVKKLMCNPYAYYADKILRLKKLDPIDMEPGNREFGDIAHKVIEHFVKYYDNIPNDDMLGFIIDNWNNLLEKNNIPQSMQAFWQPRFKSIAEEFVIKEYLIRKENKVFGEVKGVYKITLDDGREFKITARADRIEQGMSGKIKIIDYKSSEVKNIAKGLMNGTLPQMPLEALIANNNGFEGVSEGIAEELEYWILKGKNDKNPAIEEDKISLKLNSSKVASYKSSLEDLMEITASGVAELANVFSKETTPYKSCPDPEKMPDFNEFEHLARHKEW